MCASAIEWNREHPDNKGGGSILMFVTSEILQKAGAVASGYAQNGLKALSRRYELKLNYT